MSPIYEKKLDHQRSCYSIDQMPHLNKETAFSSKQYLTTSIALVIFANISLPFCLPVTILFSAASFWYLWSATIIWVNKIAKNIENPKIQQFIRYLHSTTLEFNTVLTLAALFPLTLCKTYHYPKKPLHGRPILMINGYCSFGSTWHYQREKLTSMGFGPIYTMNIGSGKSIKTYAQQVAQKVEEIQKATNRTDLVLIGHSKGGLVCSYYATQLAKDTKTEVTDIITICSPLNGTPLAILGLGKDAREMQLNNPFHQNLRKQIQEDTKIRFHHIASKADEIVPYQSALIQENQHLLLEDLGHVGVLFSSRVANQMCLWLKEPTAAQL